MHAFNILFLGFLFIKYLQNIMTEANIFENLFMSQIYKGDFYPTTIQTFQK